MQLEAFKTEISQILDRYQIPMDDKSFIMEKIDGGLGDILKEVRKHVDAERGKSQEQMLAYEKQVKKVVADTLRKAQENVKQAYQVGVREGMGQAPKASGGMGLFQILIVSGLLILAGFVVFREFFPKKEGKDRSR